MELDTLGLDEAPAGKRLSDAAGWNLHLDDWRRMIAYPDSQVFSGRVDGDVVATTSLVWYDDICWVGLVLVDPDHQRRGYGSRIMERAMDRATDRSDRIGLDATDQGRPIYLDMGFVDVGPVDRWSGTVEGGEPALDVRPLQPDRLDDVVAFDRDVSGADRRDLLEIHLAADRSRGFLVADGDVRGYAMTFPGREAWQLGPLVATDEEALRSLLAAAGEALGSTPVVVDAVREESRSEVYEEFGLEAPRSLVRMTYERPRPLLTGDALHAGAGLQWG